MFCQVFSSQTSRTGKVLVALFLASIVLIISLGFPSSAAAADFIVDTTDDTPDATPGDGLCADAGDNCSLRAAIDEANALAGDDTITVPAGTYTLTIAGASEDGNATGDLDISSNITLNGADTPTTIVDAAGLDRAFHVVGATVGFNNLTIRNGVVADFGAGIYDDGGTVTVTECTISNGTITDNHSGGGIANDSGSLTVIASTIYNNTADSGSGGGIYNMALMDIENSTISGNSAGSGGGITNVNSGSVTLKNTTIAANTSTGGAGIQNLGTANVTNSIIAVNIGADCQGTVTSNDYNIDSDGTCGLNQPNDIPMIDPELDPLGNYGGPTWTHRLQVEESQAIDAGDCSGGTITEDQRSVSRPQGPACDIGSFELEVGGVEYDFGDAPDPTYPTLLANNGARHLTGGDLYLGTLWDAEGNGLPTADALGDDLDNLDDEDGVLFSPLATGASTAVTVSTSAPGYLHAWIDYNDDGDWDDVGEKIFSGVYLSTGTTPLSFLVPVDAVVTPSTIARFRVTSASVLSYDGEAPDGEVEDYALAIERGNPAANPDSASTVEGTSVLIDVLANDYDPHGTISLDSVGTPSNGTAVIEGDAIRYTPADDFFGTDTFEYTTANDAGGTATASVSVFVAEVNKLPTDIDLSNTSLAATCLDFFFLQFCGVFPGTEVGQLSTVDPNPNDTHQYSFGVGPDNYLFTIAGDTLLTAWHIDVGTYDSEEYGISVVSVDSGTLTVEKPFTITVFGEGIGPGPQDINLSNDEIPENEPAGTVVGNLSTLDPSGGPHTYTLVPGSGSDDNDFFTIDGDQLKVAQEPNFEEKELHSVRISTDNGTDPPLEKPFTIQVIDDNTEPGEPPPTKCSGDPFTIIDTEDTTVEISDVSVSNATANGCDITGQMRVSIPGTEATGISISGHVNEKNLLYTDGSGRLHKSFQAALPSQEHALLQDGPIAPFELDIAGIPLHVNGAEIEYYMGRPGLRLNDAEFCIPEQWGGLCAPAYVESPTGSGHGGGMSFLIDGSGLSMGGGASFALPEITLVKSGKITLAGVTAKLIPVAGGYEITAGADFGLPKFQVKGVSGCTLSAAVTIYKSTTGETILVVESQPLAPDEMRLSAITLGVSCDQGIPIDSTGLALTGVKGTVSLRPDDQWVELVVTIETIRKIPVLDISPITINGGTRVLWDPEWGLDVFATIKLLKVFEAANASASIREGSFSAQVHITALVIDGDISVNAWTDQSTFLHLTGSGRVVVGFIKGAIWEECACFPVPHDVCWKWFVPYPCDWYNECACVSIPPFDLHTPPIGADVGEFTNGQWGFKGYAEILGSQYGFYVDTEPSLHIGGVDDYQLVTPPMFLQARQQWQAARQQAQLNGMTLEPTVWDDIFLFPSDHEATIKTSLVPSEQPIVVAGQVISQIHVFTQTDTVFVLSAATDLTMTLTAPDGTVITPDNYGGPPVYPTYTVSYSQSTIYQIKRAVEVTTTFQPRLRFIPASTHSSMDAVDVLVDGTVMFANVGLMDPVPHDYIPLNRGVHTIEIVPAGGGTLIVSTILEAEYETDYSVVASGVDTPAITVLTDDNTVPDALGQARVRFVQSTPYPGTVNVFVDGVQVLADADYLDVGNYHAITPGEVLVEIQDASSGNDLSPPRPVILRDGHIYTLHTIEWNADGYVMGWIQLMDEAYIPRVYTQYNVAQAPTGDWLITLDGDLDSANPMLGIIGIANLPILSDVTADATDLSQTEVSWSLMSDYSPTEISIYVNPGSITDTIVYTDTGGLTATQVVTAYQGVLVDRLDVAGRQRLDGKEDTHQVDLSNLATGDYYLWMRAEDGVNPPMSAYARTTDLQEIAIISVDQTGSFPISWSPLITPVLSVEEARLYVEWEALAHPDVDSYSLYVGTSPLSPTTVITGLSSFFQYDQNGNPVGGPTVNANVSNVEPGRTYYVSVEATDEDSGQSVRSAEIELAVPTGNYQLVTPQDSYAAVPGSQLIIPLSLAISEPLFYSNVRLAIDDVNTSPGFRIQFEDDLAGITLLNAGDDTVNVMVSLANSVPDGRYTITFVGYNGELVRSVDMDILVGAATRIYLPLIAKNHGTSAYREDFESGSAGPEWSKPVVDTAPNGQMFLGQFGAEDLHLTLTNLPAHNQVTVTFDLYAIRGWDGNEETFGPDVWDLGVAGEATLLHTTFSNWDLYDAHQAYPDAYPGGDHPARTGAAANNTLGYEILDPNSGTMLPMDATYRLTYTFAHSGDTLVLNFEALGLQVIEDESWGLDNVEVTWH